MAFHTAKHNLSFRSNDCSANLIKNFFDIKFSLGRTKTGALITNVIAPFIDNCMLDAISKTNFVSIITDTSNHKSTKILPVVIRYFDTLKGVLNWKVNISSIYNDKSSKIYSLIMDVV